MAKGKTENKPEERTEKKRNLFDDFIISPAICGRKFVYKGDTYDTDMLTIKQLEILAADVNFRHIKKK